MRLILTILTAAFILSPSPTTEGKTVFIEYHHTKYIYKHDDIGLVRLTVKDIEDML